jgi:hypothetical protein
MFVGTTGHLVRVYLFTGTACEYATRPSATEVSEHKTTANEISHFMIANQV